MIGAANTGPQGQVDIPGKAVLRANMSLGPARRGGSMIEVLQVTVTTA